MCAPLVITGIPLNCFFFFSRGTAWLVTVVQRRGCYKSLIWILDAESTYLLGCGVDKLSLQSSRIGLVSSADVHGPPSSCRPDLDLSFWPHFLLKAPRLFRAFLDLSGFGFLRLACGTAVKSVRISISVSLPVRVRDEPVECLPWTRRTGVCPYLPCSEMYVPRARRRLMPKVFAKIC